MATIGKAAETIGLPQLVGKPQRSRRPGGKPAVQYGGTAPVPLGRELTSPIKRAPKALPLGAKIEVATKPHTKRVKTSLEKKKSGGGSFGLPRGRRMGEGRRADKRERMETTGSELPFPASRYVKENRRGSRVQHSSRAVVYPKPGIGMDTKSTGGVTFKLPLRASGYSTSRNRSSNTRRDNGNTRRDNANGHGHGYAEGQKSKTTSHTNEYNEYKKQPLGHMNKTASGSRFSKPLTPHPSKDLREKVKTFGSTRDVIKPFLKPKQQHSGNKNSTHVLKLGAPKDSKSSSTSFGSWKQSQGSSFSRESYGSWGPKQSNSSSNFRQSYGGYSKTPKPPSSSGSRNWSTAAFESNSKKGKGKGSKGNRWW